ncbi:Cofactor of BRCA1 [Gryganskiella cystojenkinii]|nr:Cofactor of BRCA1 [Gryganskiella cystojenkinii]
MDQQALLGARSSDKIRDMLVKQNPIQAIRQIQDNRGLNYNDIDSIYPLLDHHGKSRYKVHSACMEALKAKLLQKLETAQMDHKRFDSTLEAMLPYIDVKGLRELPMTLLGRYPDRMSKDIIDKIGSDNDLFNIAPKEVQRRIWLSNANKFREDVIPIVMEYKGDPEVIRMAREMSVDNATKVISQRRSHPSIKKLIEFVGGNLKLYNHIGTYLRSLFLQSNDTIFCTLRFDLLMSMHEANINQITKADPCHELVWNLDACNRTLSMDERRVDNIRKFFDKIDRDDPVYGDIAMILNDPFTSNMIASRLLELLNENVEAGRKPQEDPTLIWTATMLNLGAHSRRILQTQKFRIPKVDAVVTEKFTHVLSDCILEDTIRQLKQVDDNTEVKSIESSDGVMESLDESEVARKLLCHYILDKLEHSDIYALERVLPAILKSLTKNHSYDYENHVGGVLDSLHVTYQSFFHSFLGLLSKQVQISRFLTTPKWQQVIMTDLLLPAAENDSSVYEQVVRFLSEAFRLVASSGRAGVIGNGFLQLPRWIETLYSRRPVDRISKKQNDEVRAVFARIVMDATQFSGGRYRMKPEEIPNVMSYIQDGAMDTSG